MTAVDFRLEATEPWGLVMSQGLGGCWWGRRGIWQLNPASTNVTPCVTLYNRRPSEERISWCKKSQKVYWTRVVGNLHLRGQTWACYPAEAVSHCCHRGRLRPWGSSQRSARLRKKQRERQAGASGIQGVSLAVGMDGEGLGAWVGVPCAAGDTCGRTNSCWWPLPVAENLTGTVISCQEGEGGWELGLPTPQHRGHLSNS